MKAYKKSLESFYDNPIVLNNCGIITSKEKDYEAAINYFKSASELEPRSDIYAHLSMAYLESNDIANASQYANLAVNKAPNESRAHFALGMINFKKENFDDALEDFATALENDPNFQEAYLMRAKVNIKLSLTRTVEDDLLKVLSFEPENKEARRLLESFKN